MFDGKARSLRAIPTAYIPDEAHRFKITSSSWLYQDETTMRHPMLSGCDIDLTFFQRAKVGAFVFETLGGRRREDASDNPCAGRAYL